MNRLTSKLQNLALLILPLVLLTAVLSGCGETEYYNFPFEEIGAEQEPPLLIGQVPSHSIIEIVEKREDFLTSLSKNIERDAQFRFAPSYEAMVERLQDGRYDMAILGPFSYVKAARKTDYLPLVKPVRFGQPHYRSIIFTHRDSEITNLGEIEGQSIAFVDPGSASGYLFPRAHLIQNHGFDPAREPTRQVFTGSHDRVARAVLERRVSAGATFKDARTLLEDEEAVEKLPVLTKTEPIPSEPIVTSPGLRENKKLFEKIRGYFLRLHELDKAALSSLGEDIDRLVKASDSDYNEVRKIAESLDLVDDGQ